MSNFGKELQRHYAMLLGMESPWEVDTVKLDMAAKRVEIRLNWRTGGKVVCPECGRECSLYDQAPERSWRHLDTMQFETVLQARVPRANCPEHGVKVVRVPWAEPHGRFTRLFESFAIEVLLASQSVSHGAELLRLSWDQAHEIMARAVERGLIRRSVEGLKYVGMDEKNFGRGHSYVSVLTDLEQARVLEVVPERTQAAADQLWQSLTPEQRQSIEAVALDMWEAYMNSASAHVPDAAVVHDKFHISGHLGEAVDKVRRQEHRQLRREDDQTLNGSKYLWLMNPMNMNAEQARAFASLRYSGLKVARAWAMKELFTKLWNYRYEGAARNFFDRWYGWAVRSRLEPMKKVARMLKGHLENILTYLRHPITNAVTEGLNSKIQMLKANARGFRNFQNYRTRILFFCGKLSLSPQ